MLKREGLVVNHKRTERIYREDTKSKGAAGARVLANGVLRIGELGNIDYFCFVAPDNFGHNATSAGPFLPIF